MRSESGFKFKRNKINSSLLSLFVFSTLYAGTAFAVPGVTYNVNSTNDVIDAAPGDGICNTGGVPPPGQTYECTLRAAIQESNAHFPNTAGDPDIIALPAGTYVMAIAGTGEDNAATGDFDVRDHLRINGAGETVTIVNANNMDRGFHVMAGTSASFNNFTVRNGTAPTAGYPAAHGGGIHNLGTLALDHMTVENSYALWEGGGVYNTGLFTVTNSRIVYNTGAGGLSNAANGQMTVDNSVIAANSSGAYGVAGMGGGIRSFGVALTVKNSLIAGNNAARDGGGMYFGGYATPLIENVTVSGNRASRYGGGIHARNKANIKSSTISNNYASQNGGGLYVFNSSSSSNAVVTLHNTIAAGNLKGWSVANDCAVPPSESGSGTNYAQLTSLGYNIDKDNSCHLTAVGDMPSTDPLLGPLQNNGGFTDTHALLTGSPAIDNGAPTCPATDQRGVSRPQDGDGNGVAVCDIGAFEKN